MWITMAPGAIIPGTTKQISPCIFHSSLEARYCCYSKIWDGVLLFFIFIFAMLKRGRNIAGVVLTR
jgi:hypothetical protein